jgi:hypothetical protein
MPLASSGFGIYDIDGDHPNAGDSEDRGHADRPWWTLKSDLLARCS